MKAFPLRAALFLAAAMLLLPALAACEESKITADSFEQIKVGMNQYEVETILGGSGTDDTSSAGYGVSAGGVLGAKAADEKRLVWSEGESKIIVVFKDGKVVEKSKVSLD